MRCNTIGADGDVCRIIKKIGSFSYLSKCLSNPNASDIIYDRCWIKYKIKNCPEYLKQ